MLTINAGRYRRMLCDAAAALQAKKEAINRMNVFPVPDGDTGSNLFLTLDAARSVPLQTDDLAAYAEASAKAVMRSARGNSGVILSLFFRGMAEAFAGHETADAALLIQAFERGSESARKAVMKPVEGTILTVMRECTKFNAPDDAGDVRRTLEHILQKAREVLAKTPEMLPALKRAKVVDSGGCGFTVVLDGMLRALNGETQEEEQPEAVENAAAADFSAFSGEEIVFSFCTECLLSRAAEVTESDVEGLRLFLSGVGDSVVLAADGEFVKVHVHTNEPLSVLNRLSAFGVPQLIKVENMKQQHSTFVAAAEQKERLPETCGVVAAASGDGLRNLLTELGAGAVIDGGQSRNPSAGDFLKAIKKLPCRRVILLPNNANVILTARQAAAMAEGVQAEVVQTATVPQGIAALIAFRASVSLEDNLSAMRAAGAAVRTLAVTRAVKNADIGGIRVRRKQYIGLADNALRYAKDSLQECLLALASESVGREIITLYYGKEVEPEEAEHAAGILRQAIGPKAEISVVFGGQPIYPYLISAE